MFVQKYENQYWLGQFLTYQNNFYNKVNKLKQVQSALLDSLYIKSEEEKKKTIWNEFHSLGLFNLSRVIYTC